MIILALVIFFSCDYTLELGGKNGKEEEYLFILVIGMTSTHHADQSSETFDDFVALFVLVKIDGLEERYLRDTVLLARIQEG